MSEGPISVGELSRRIKEAVERPFQRVWVEGELGEVKISAGGHAYLSLKDDEGLIQCVIWAQTLRGLSQRPPPGSRVEIYGRLTLYPPRGAYQLEVQRLRLAGVGQLQLAFEALKQRLAAEGLFDPARKRPIPALPRAIGLLTSPTGAAVRDMEAVLDRRAPQIPIYLMPTLVQGRGAAEAIARGLDALAAHPDVEVILLARGGGSLEDLWAFNEEIVARAVARCPTPIISGVGHETDFTIADFVADLRAATPSEAAEKAAPARDALRFNLAALEDRAGRAMAAIITRERRRLDDLQRRAALDLGLDRLRLEINALSQRQARAIDGRLSGGRRALAEAERRLSLRPTLSASRRDLSALTRRLEAQSPITRAAQTRAALGLLRHRLAQAERGLLLQPRRALLELEARLWPQGAARLATARRALTELQGRLERATTRQVTQARANLHAQHRALGLLSPLKILDRGYSIALGAAGVVQEAAALRIGEALELRLRRGRVIVEVTEIKEHPMEDEDEHT